MTVVKTYKIGTVKGIRRLSSVKTVITLSRGSVRQGSVVAGKGFVKTPAEGSSYSRSLVYRGTHTRRST